METEQMEKIQSPSRWLTLGGFAWFLVAWLLGWPGMVVGWMTGWLGLSGIVFSVCTWRKGPEVQILVLLFLLTSLVSCGIMQMEAVAFLFHGSFFRKVLGLVEFIAGFVLLRLQCNYLFSIARRHRALAQLDKLPI